MKTKHILFAAMIFFTRPGFSQNTFRATGNAGIVAAAPDASSALEIKSTAKGLLISRITKTQRDAVASPATGLMIYQTTNMPGFFYYDGNAWTAVTPKAKGWLPTGNSGNAFKRVNLSGSGQGSLNVDTSTLSAGAYHYSLYVDGKLIGSKAMAIVN